jgi:DNA-binding GntR family transcriptional regulator
VQAPVPFAEGRILLLVQGPPIASTPELRNRRTTSDHIADALRAAINGGQLEDGAVLNQVELAEHFGVSRVPVREAMRRLEAEGLIDASAHRRAVVRGLSLERLTEAYELRALLEGHLAAAAVPHLDKARLDRLAAINRELRETTDHVRYLELNGQFHTTLYEAANRPLALEFVDTLRQRAERYVQMWSRGRGLDRGRQVTREHGLIVRLARAGDADGVRRAVTEHIEHTLTAVLELHDDQQPAARDGRAGRAAAVLAKA